MLLVLFTLEDFIRVGKLSPARDITTATERGRTTRAHKAFRGQKVAGGTSLWNYCMRTRRQFAHSSKNPKSAGAKAGVDPVARDRAIPTTSFSSLLCLRLGPADVMLHCAITNSGR